MWWGLKGIIVHFLFIIAENRNYYRYNRYILLFLSPTSNVGEVMSSLNGVDPVFAAVKNHAQYYGFNGDGPLGQQILLLGDSFYGYRFTSREYTAIWSANDHTLTFFDVNGKKLGVSSLYTTAEVVYDNAGTIPFRETTPHKKAA